MAAKTFQKEALFYGALSVAALLIVISFSGSGSGLKDSLSSISGKAATAFMDPVELSQDQAKLTQRMGYPDSFIITMDNHNRLEVWFYNKWEKSFTFLNGAYQKDSYQPKVPDIFVFPRFRPTQFRNAMTKGDVRGLLGEPTAEGQLNLAMIKGVAVLDYLNQVKIGIKDSKVIYVETLPIPLDK